MRFALSAPDTPRIPTSAVCPPAGLVTRRAALAVLAVAALSACANQTPADGSSAAAPSAPKAVTGPNGVDAAAPIIAPPSVASSASATATMDAVNALTAAAATHTAASSAAITTSAAVQAASGVQHSVMASPSVAAPPLPNGAVGAAPTGNLASVPAPLVTVRLPASARLGPLEFISQTLNNCGPASVAEVLHYWGINRTQGAVQAVLRADGNPRGMEPFGVPSYIRSLGMAVVMGVEGTDTVVKALVAKGFPVIVNQWVSLNDHAGHFRPIEAYDDGRGGFVASDPYLGPNHFISYAEFDQIWRTNRGRFMVIHPPSRQAQVQAILKSAGWDQTIAYQTDLTQQQQHHWPAGVNPPAKFAEFGRSFGALNQAFDQIQLGQFAAARAALAQAKANNANPVLVNWITALLPA